MTKKLSVGKFSVAKNLSGTEANKLEIFLSFSYCNFKTVINFKRHVQKGIFHLQTSLIVKF